MKPIVVTEIYHQDIKTVWSAITELDQMVLWFFDTIPEFKAEVGFKTTFNIRSGERDFLHVWEITEVVPQRKITYDWKYPEYYDGSSYVVFELFPIDATKTKIQLTATGGENFPQDIPEFKRESGVQGWNYFIKERLKAYLKA